MDGHAFLEPVDQRIHTSIDVDGHVLSSLHLILIPSPKKLNLFQGEGEGGAILWWVMDWGIG